MANNISTESMQRELENIKFKLDQASKILAQKDLLIGGLEEDIDHMIRLLSENNRSRGACNADEANKQWILRSVPGLNLEVNNQQAVV